MVVRRPTFLIEQGQTVEICFNGHLIPIRGVNSSETFLYFVPGEEYPIRRVRRIAKAFPSPGYLRAA